MSERSAGAVGGGVARGPRAPRAEPLRRPSRPPRSPRKRRWRRHGGAYGSGESHRDGLPQGTRVRETPNPDPPGSRACPGRSPSLASGSTPQPDSPWLVGAIHGVSAPREKALALTGNQGIEAAMDW